MKKWLVVFIGFAFAAVLPAGSAGANGTLTATVLYNGQPVQNAYVYLQSASQLAPRQQYYESAAYILGPSDATGHISVSVPEGTWYVRITKRASFSTSLGPPFPGDYSWYYAGTKTITTNSVVSLGNVPVTIYTQSVAVSISGTVKGASGKVLSGWAVKASTAPCESGNWAYAHSFNECGSVKYPAFTDSNGNYTITIPNTGTYYVYASPNLNFANTNYPGGYPTCASAVGCEACGDYFYYNCPIIVNTSATGKNVTVPGY